MRPLLLLALVAGSGGLVGCAGEPSTPEQQVRERIAEAEEAAEAKEAGALVGMLAEGFAGMGHALGAGPPGIGTAPFPQSRQSAAGSIHAALSYYEDVHVLTRIAGLTVEGDTAARATVFAALSAAPITSPQALSSVEAALYRFDVAFERDGDEWLVTQAAWRRAQPGDFV